ncbi:MAG TPA: cardiolipin synthase [Chitinophagaceae bacterium]|nr:cardiolipin synthase [Chitinophagaceae bacterium]HQX97899.1 cardiolipin synthase [Chitinophagaceae bacterium]HQZ49912.1 cardiolipin synthase [Chitinophagaceae bacterium]
MSLLILISLFYFILLVFVCVQIVISINYSAKALAYLLFAIFIPVIGIIFYLTFGINYWKKRKYNKKTLQDGKILDYLKNGIVQYNESSISRLDESVQQNAELASMLMRDLGSPLTKNNKVTLLKNGEEKFPNLIEAIRNATHHIHIEYYIYEYDDIGTEIIELLIQKAKEGVEVRFIYDDFGSPTIKMATEKRMQEAGAKVLPFHKVRFYLLANRFNYRNHRKIVVIDGQTGFVGGINVSDKYINNNKNKLFWRDTHLRIDGPAVYYLQYLFITDWKFCCDEELETKESYFKIPKKTTENSFVQIAASGPDSILPSILYSILQAIYLAKKEILITTPYFIPGDGIINALNVAALSGLSVKLLVPGISDSKIVNAASKSYYAKLLQAGVEIYFYKKGFVHAKTMVADSMLTIVGTANMDYRSFEFNFEVNALVYDQSVAEEMRNTFFEDLKNAEQIDKKAWLSRPWYAQLPEKIARLFSPVL